MKKFLSMILACAALMTTLSACSKKDAPDTSNSSYPKRAITVVTSKSGSAVDTNCRALTQYLTELLGVNVVVTNTAGQTEALREVMGADPDGYTLHFGNTSPIISDAVNAVEFDTIDEFEIVSIVSAGTGMAVALTADRAAELGIATFDDLVAYAEQHPYELTITSQPNNSSGASVSALLSSGLQVSTVDVGGNADRLTAMLAGNIDIYAGNYGNIEQYVQTGEVICLCTMGNEPNPYAVEGTHYAGEYGITTDYPTYYYMSAPKGTPDEVLKVLGDAIEKITEMPEYVELLTATTQIPDYQNHEDATATLSAFREGLSGNEVIGMN